MGKRFLIIKHNDRDPDYIYSEKVIEFLLSKGMEVLVCDNMKDKYPSLKIKSKNDLHHIDCGVILGGDGSLLDAANLYVDYDIPFFGINLGRVGALADASTDDYLEKLQKIIDDDYFVEKRNVLDVSIDVESGHYECYSLNDVVIHRGSRLHTMKINFEVSGEGRATCYADGILVATSTGSSAYNLSSGGSLMLPTTDAFSIAPISPQLKTFVPIVVSASADISISIDDPTKREAYKKDSLPNVVVDGLVKYDILPGDKVSMKKSKKKLRIIKTDRNASLYTPIDKVMKAKI